MNIQKLLKNPKVLGGILLTAATVALILLPRKETTVIVMDGNSDAE